MRLAGRLRSVIASLVVLIALRSPTQAQSGDQVVTLDTAQGRVSGALRLPKASRPPVVCLVSASNSQDLSSALAAEGVASLRLDATDEATAAQWIAFLRNDERFPTVTVFGEGASLDAAVVAARAARADGVVTRGDLGATASEVARLVAAKTAVNGESPAADASRIAEFARTVQVLGRRGTSSVRPASGRRSLRHVILATLGSLRVGIEWGQPGKRDREIWGGLVKWNEVWMPGADEATTLTTNGPITLGSLDVPAGDHTFYVLPTPDRFQLIVSNDVGQFHIVRDPALDLGQTDMTLLTKTGVVEGLTFSLESRGSTGTLRLIWDTREYSVTLASQKSEGRSWK